VLKVVPSKSISSMLRAGIVLQKLYVFEVPECVQSQRLQPKIFDCIEQRILIGDRIKADVQAATKDTFETGTRCWCCYATQSYKSKGLGNLIWPPSPLLYYKDKGMLETRAILFIEASVGQVHCCNLLWGQRIRANCSVFLPLVDSW
jgi:hypothetical protein